MCVINNGYLLSDRFPHIYVTCDTAVIEYSNIWL